MGGDGAGGLVLYCNLRPFEWVEGSVLGRPQASTALGCWHFEFQRPVPRNGWETRWEARSARALAAKATKPNSSRSTRLPTARTRTALHGSQLEADTGLLEAQVISQEKRVRGEDTGG